MSIRKSLCVGAAGLLLTLTAGRASAQMVMKSPDQVKPALSTLNRVVGHTQRLMDAKNYTRLPHENGEFKEGAKALDQAIASESARFKSKLKPLLDKALADSQSVADAADAHDDAKLATTHAAFAASVGAVLAVFPDSVQPGPASPPSMTTAPK